MGFIGAGDVSADDAAAAAAAPRRRRRWGPDANLLADNTPLYLLQPKQDEYGLGYDPFHGAEAFREAKKRRRDEAAESKEVPGVLPSYCGGGCIYRCRVSLGYEPFPSFCVGDH